MKKAILILLALLILIGGPALYFLSSPDRQVVETFSTFGFKNDAVERPATEGEEDWYGGELGDPEEVTEYEDEWYGGGSDGDDSSASDGASDGSSGGQGGGADSSDTETTTDTSLAYTPSQTTPSTATTPKVSTPSTPAVTPSYTLTVTSPTAGSVLNNAGPTDIAKVFWSYGDLTAKITVELWNKSGLVRTLTTKTGNSGRYAWAHSPTLQDGDYKLILRAYSSSGTLVTSAETGYFEVSRVKEEEIAPAQPKNPSSPSAPPTVDWMCEEMEHSNSFEISRTYFEGVPLKIKTTQTFLENPTGAVVPLQFVFSQDQDSGNISVVELPPGPTPAHYDAWISKTPGGTPIFEKQTFGALGGNIDFVHPSLKANGGRYALREQNFLDHGTYYYNLDPEGPAASVLAVTLRGGAGVGLCPEVQKLTPLVCTELTKDLERGDIDTEVKKLQEFLNATGFTVSVYSGSGAPGNEYTTFDQKTEIAVERFQMRYGITQTGAVGPNTRAKIKSLSCGTSSSGEDNSVTSFAPAPIVRNVDGIPIVTSTYDLNANPFHRLIPAVGGTESIAIAFPATKGGTFMMSPGINDYVRPDRTEVNISAKPHDFTPMQTACRQVNEISSEISLQWVIKASDAPSWGACILEQGKIYYFNIRYVKADGTTACSENRCGAYIDLPF